MLRTIFAAVCGLFFSVSVAQADELNWSGFSVGLVGTYNLAGVDFANPGTPDQKFPGFLGGVSIEYDHEFPNRLVIGITADAMFGRLFDMKRDGNYIVETGEVNAMGTIRALAGYDAGMFMPYVTGGATWEHLTEGISCPSPAAAPFGFCHKYGPFDLKGSGVVWGWNVGAGVKVRVSKNSNLDFAYLHTQFSPQTVSLDGGITKSTFTPKLGTVMVKWQYRF